MNSRDLKMPSGSIGARAVASRQTNAASPATPTNSVTSTIGEPRPLARQAISA